jgi:DNA-binding NtrC family response regulator
MIHANSIRSDKPYVTVNCASISPSLFESEFFGHVRGSFTGANQDKQGFFQLADKGTLFLDEISEIPMEFQAKLLRAIDTKTIIPVGKGNEEKINCKIITATNNNIHKLIIENKFRLDLFHRINTIEIRISALRDRIEDLPDLVNYYVERFASETKKRKPRIAKGFLERLSTYPFPGNVRELKNYIERLFVMHYRPVWEASILDNINTLSTIQQSTTLHTGSDIKSIEAQLIRDALLKCEGKQKAAAKLLHLTESTLSRKIKRLGIKG